MMSAAPWMKGPVLVETTYVSDLSKHQTTKKPPVGKKYTNDDRALTDKVSGARGRHALRKIFKGIEKLKNSYELEENQKNQDKVGVKFLFGDIWGDKDSDFDEKLESEKDRRLLFESTNVEELEETRTNSDVIDFGVQLRGLSGDEDLRLRRKMPWQGEEKKGFPRPKKKKTPSAAELTLDRMLLDVLRDEAVRMRKWVKVNKAGVTEAVVEQIHLIWKNSELAMLKFDLPLCRNMDRAREIVEFKTGGLVVWVKKDALVVYRGCNYQPSSKTSAITPDGSRNGTKVSWKENFVVSRVKSSSEDPMGIKENIAIYGSLYEREADRLLDGLGPRFVDWWYPKPLPVDADLLPQVVPGFKPPYRLCPPRVKSSLADDELTYLRKFARPLPIHFALGRNRNLQGLAVAILKLWEKCHIAKIALKWGIPNINNEQIANELKALTGGVLLLRNKFIIILYRGKDFLPREIANLVTAREIELNRCQLQEETAKLNAAESFCLENESLKSSAIAGTLSEFHNIQLEYGNLKSEEQEVELKAGKGKLKKELRNQEHKHFIVNKKIKRSVTMLRKLNSAWRPAEADADHESITEEERECLRKIGLKMDCSLLLGRRGIFDGVIEGLHQHWKHREVVKVITMQKNFSQALFTCKLLEAESGGMLVSVDRLKRGHAIIIYRGKNYRRPLKLATQNLLNKKEALMRSLAMQRIGSLKFFAHQRQQTISSLKLELETLRHREVIDE